MIRRPHNLSRQERRTSAVLGKDSGLDHAAHPAAQVHSHGGAVLSMAHSLGVSVDSIDDFSTNTFFSAKSLTAELVKDTPYLFEHYPDSHCTALREAIAEHEDVSPEQIIIGNGSAELIFLFMPSMPGCPCWASLILSIRVGCISIFNTLPSVTIIKLSLANYC